MADKTTATIDDIWTDDLAAGMTIGKVTALLEEVIREGAELYAGLRLPGAEYQAASRSVQEWRNSVQAQLTGAFSSPSPALRFAISRSFAQWDPPIVGVQEMFFVAAKALLDVQTQHLEKREQIARTAHELAREVAHRDEIARLLRDNHSMTQGLWDKMVKDQFAAPSIGRMIGLGVAPNAIWDLLKVAGGFFVAGALHG